MTKVLKKIKVPKTDAVIFKRVRSPFWYVQFPTKRKFNKDGMFKKSLQQENCKNALKLAYKEYIDFMCLPSGTFLFCIFKCIYT